METIIGNYKQYVIVERSELDKIEKKAIQQMEDNEYRGVKDKYVEAKAVYNLIKEIKRLNIYNNDFKIKG